jgi:thioredoxin reductase (NADPH)
MSDKKKYQTIIIGAGPAGFSAAIYTARAGIATLVIGNPFESQVAKLGLIENYPGFKKGVQGLELAEEMDKQTRANGAAVLYDLVVKIEKTDSSYKVTTDADEEYETDSILLAMGSRHKKMRVKGEDEFFAKGISYCAVCDGALYQGKKTAVLGYGNGAAKAALYLANISSKVYLLCPRKTLEADTIYEHRLKGLDNIEIHYLARTTEIGGGEFVEFLKYKESKEETEIAVDGVFIEFGSVPNTVLAEQLGVEVNEKGFIVNDPETMETNVPGVYAAGDVCGRIRQIATAVGDGCVASYSIQDYLEEKGQ